MRKTTTPVPHTFTSENLETKVPDTTPLDMQEPQRKQPHQQLINDLAGMYATIGIAVTAFDMYDGMIIIQKSVDRAKEMVNVAKHHPSFLKLLKQITKSNDYIVALSGHGLMLYAIMAHHGRIPANMVLLQQTGYADIPIVQQQAEQLFQEAVPVPVETDEQLKQDAYNHYMQGQAQEIIHQDIAEYEDAYVRSPLVYTVPDAKLGAYAIETPVGGDGQNRT